MSNDFKIEEILAAIKDSGSIVSTIAKRLGVSWYTAKSYIDKYEETKRAYEDEKEEILDKAESAVFNSIIQEKDIPSAKWLLSTKGKKRGYSEKHEIAVDLDNESLSEFLEIANNFKKSVNDN